jgi:hypothetical protein
MAAPQLLGAGMSLYDTQEAHTTSGHPVGAFGILEGRGYVWCSHTGSSSLNRGEPLVAAPAMSQSNLATTTTAISVGMLAIAGITMNSAVAAHALAGGFVFIVDGGGEGTAYRIRDNTAYTAETADGVLTLEEPIKVAGDANTEVTVIQSKFANPVQSDGIGLEPFVGIPNVTVPAGNTTTQYFWAQRVGYCGAFVEGSPKRGASVVVARRTRGRLAAARDVVEVDHATEGGRTVHELDRTGIIGSMVTDAIDGEIQIVDLQNTMF